MLKNCSHIWREKYRSEKSLGKSASIKFWRLKDEQRRQSLKSFFYQQWHYPHWRYILKHQENLIQEKMRAEMKRVRWKFHESGKTFFIFTESQKYFFHLAEKRFHFSSVAAPLEACWNCRIVPFEKEKWKIFLTESSRVRKKVKWKNISHT